jgi:hypothetical protein
MEGNPVTDESVTTPPEDFGPPPSADSIVPPGPAPKKTARRWIIIAIVVAAVVLVGVVVLVVFLVRSVTADAKPSRYTSERFGYAVTLPGKPTVTNRTADDGEPTQQLQWAGVGGQSVTFDAERTASVIPTSRYSAAISAGLDSSLKGVGGAATSPRKSFTIDGQPAESQLFTSTSTGDGYEAITIKGDEIYVVVITHTTAALQHAVDSSITFTN